MSDAAEEIAQARYASRLTARRTDRQHRAAELEVKIAKRRALFKELDDKQLKEAEAAAGARRKLHEIQQAADDGSEGDEEAWTVQVAKCKDTAISHQHAAAMAFEELAVVMADIDDLEKEVRMARAEGASGKSTTTREPTPPILPAASSVPPAGSGDGLATGKVKAIADSAFQTFAKASSPGSSFSSLVKGDARYTIPGLDKPPDYPRNGSLAQYRKSIDGWEAANDDPNLKSAIPKHLRGFVVIQALRRQSKENTLPPQFASLLTEEVMPSYGTTIETVMEKVSAACGDASAEDVVKFLADMTKKRQAGNKIQEFVTEFAIAEARYHEHTTQDRLPVAFLATLIESQLNLHTPGSQCLAVEVRRARKEAPETMTTMLASHSASFPVIEAEERAMASSGANRVVKSNTTLLATSVPRKVGVQAGDKKKKAGALGVLGHGFRKSSRRDRRF
jgi:hypothetical protein